MKKLNIYVLSLSISANISLLCIEQIISIDKRISENKKAEEATSNVRMYDIPILGYHSIDHKKNRFSISPETFRKHLETIYQSGYSTAPLKDVIARKPYLKNKKIVILRFDDSRQSQFNYIFDKKGKKIIDPDCAVGILLDFSKKYPSFGNHALFAIIAHVNFGQPEFAKEKLLFLLHNGMELVNHGYYHEHLAKSNPEAIHKNFGKALEHWENVLGKEAKNFDMIATPYGSRPQNSEAYTCLKCIRYKGKKYPQKATLFYGGKNYNKAAPSCFTKEFDPYELPTFEITTEDFDQIWQTIITKQKEQ